MTRITARQIAVQLLFSLEANRLPVEEAIELFFSEEHYGTLGDEDRIFQSVPDEEQMNYISRIAHETVNHLEEIDAIISRYSKSWKKERLSKTTLAILRCAICEILFLDDIPDSAAVNEAVELSKRYDSQQTAAFINGILGSYIRAERSEEGSDDPDQMVFREET